MAKRGRKQRSSDESAYLRELGSRLKDAVRQSNYSVAELARVLAERGVSGANSSSMSDYHVGRRAPSPYYLRHAAALTGVRLEWLLTGVRPMRVGDEVVQTPLWKHGMRDETEKEAQREFEKGFAKQKAEYDQLPAVVQVVFGEALARWMRAEPNVRTYRPPRERGEIAAAMVETLVGEWVKFRPKHWPLREERREFNDYAETRLVAMKVAMSW